MQIQSACRRLVQALLTEAAHELEEAQHELERFTSGVRPLALAELGIGAALSSPTRCRQTPVGSENPMRCEKIRGAYPGSGRTPGGVGQIGSSPGQSKHAPRRTDGIFQARRQDDRARLLADLVRARSP